MITSFQNPTVQWVRSLLSKKDSRHQEKLFVCEGIRLAEEAISSGLEIHSAFCPSGQGKVRSFQKNHSPAALAHVLK